MNKTEILENLDIESFYKSFVPSLKTNGKPEAVGLCPFHADNNPSLSVNVETGLFRCFSCDVKGDVFTFFQKIKSVNFPAALQEIGKMAGIAGVESVKPKVVAKFEYKDSMGKTLYTKERIEPGRNGRSKEFAFKHLEDGKWVLGRGCEPVLYNLPQVARAKCVFVVEGEIKVDLLAVWGLVATCLDSGANSPIKDEYVRILGSVEKVVILPDNDKPGQEYASKIAGSLYSKGMEIKIIALPGLGEAEDIIDWEKIPSNNKSKLVELVKGASVWSPAKEQKAGLVFTKLSELFQEPEESTSWLVDGMLPSGGFSILVSKPKVGKSTLARTLMLQVSRGNSFLGMNTMKGAVIYLCLEEKRGEVRRHFRGMGASGEEEIHIYTGGTPADAIRQIQESVERLKPVLVVIDPLFRLAKVKDGNDYVQVTNALEPLLRLARDTGTHVLCVHHTPKGERGIDDCILGSQAIFGSVDTLLAMKRYEHYRTLQTRQRYGEDFEETILNFDKETRLVSIGGTRQDEDINLSGDAIIDFLSTQNEPVTESVINQGVEGAVKFKCKSLRKLVAENRINREGKGTRGNPFKYSTILLPGICVEVEKENPKMTANPHGCKDYSTSQNFDNFKEGEKSREVVFSIKNEGEFVQEKEIFEVEFVEEVEPNV